MPLREAFNVETYSAVMLAAKDANEKHGPLTKDPVRACAILIRECGEAMDEALSATTSKLPDGLSWPSNWTREQVVNNHHNSCRAALYIELAQVAATAMMIMEQLQ